MHSKGLHPAVFQLGFLMCYNISDEKSIWAAARVPGHQLIDSPHLALIFTRLQAMYYSVLSSNLSNPSNPLPDPLLYPSNTHTHLYYYYETLYADAYTSFW